jgi:membrane protein required for colicin V production
MNLTAIDVLVILTVIASAGYAAWKGFLSETLTIFDWLAAAFGCLYFGPYLVPMMRGMVSTAWLASLIAYAVVFLIVFIPLSFMSHRFSESVKSSVIGPLDRALGLAFGVVRGLAAVALVYLAYTYFVPIPEQARFVKEAQTLPMIQSTSDVILKLVPDRAKHDFAMGAPDSRRSAPSGDAIGDIIRGNRDANRVDPDQREPERDFGRDSARESPQTTPAKKAEKGYGADDRRALDTLLKKDGGTSR